MSKLKPSHRSAQAGESKYALIQWASLVLSRMDASPSVGFPAAATTLDAGGADGGAAGNENDRAAPFPFAFGGAGAVVAGAAADGGVDDGADYEGDDAGHEDVGVADVGVAVASGGGGGGGGDGVAAAAGAAPFVGGGGGGNDDILCIICNQPLREGGVVQAMPCMHVYHKGCIDTYMQVAGLTFELACPLRCRVAPVEEDVDDGLEGGGVAGGLSGDGGGGGAVVLSGGAVAVPAGGGGGGVVAVGGGGGGGGGAVWAAAAGVGSAHADRLHQLDDRRRELKRERDGVARELRNAERRRQTLVGKASGLSDQDLLDILGERATAKAKAASKATAKGKGKAKAKPKP